MPSTSEWWFMGCKVCWRRLKISQNGTYSCPTCVETEPWPRFRISVRATDIEVEDQTGPTFAEFTFFGRQGELITGTTADCAPAHAKGRTNYLPPELEKLHDKKFIVTVTTNDQTLRANFYHFKVQAIECLGNEGPLAPLPMIKPAAVPDIRGSSSSAAGEDHTATEDPLATPPPVKDCQQNNSPSETDPTELLSEKIN